VKNKKKQSKKENKKKYPRQK